MADHKLVFKPKISKRQSEKLILDLAFYSNHYIGYEPGRVSFPFKTKADVIAYYRKSGIDYNKVVNRCRDFSISVPKFENQIGGIYYATDETEVSSSDLVTGEEEFLVKGPGTFSQFSYWPQFEDAVKARDRAVYDNSYPSWLAAVTSGIASLEGYVGQRASLWNKRYPENLLIDSFDSKVSFEEKIDDWIPMMTSGSRFNKGDVVWSNYKQLRNLRDNAAIHPKESTFGISFAELARQINLFNQGIAKFQIRLHWLFGDIIPAVIIRASYTPRVLVKREF